ncbi:hypothetical protein HELRODRAFT_180800 [Helobdella robusta]|uniref:Ig-like domain-containing protein n=1 Tax=Helobdella robusta TaxID=6412 RepID=T1FGA7_HELRO|nr:hypothetical protein HELRODRAFT_180800 [Helobdella robusta]ESN93484.1 hypothetical protein HELRODRAFT_180800 [Helobdella robusta]
MAVGNNDDLDAVEIVKLVLLSLPPWFRSNGNSINYNINSNSINSKKYNNYNSHHRHSQHHHSNHSSSSSSYHNDNSNRKTYHKTANIGGKQNFDCGFPETPEPHSEFLLQWKKSSKVVPIYIQFNGYAPHFDDAYMDRIQMTDPFIMELKNIRTSDQGFYECWITIVQENKTEVLHIGLNYYLTVNC